MKNKYDLTMILKTELKDEAKDKFVKKIEKTLKAFGGAVEKTVDMGKKQLAYRIANQSEGGYVNMTLEVPGAVVVELEKKLAVDKDILRHILVRIESAATKTKKVRK